jgi:Ser/Thr protein kinase RdoA (MazF antagonist)
MEAKAFDGLSIRGRLGHLRELARRALEGYGIRAVRLELLAHDENTTFRVDDPTGGRFIVRVHRVTGSPLHPPRSRVEVASELMWLEAIRRDTDLSVPGPVRATDGEMVTLVESSGVPEARLCVVFRWQPGRFIDHGLKPVHLQRVGRFIAQLHEQAGRFSRPPGFERWRIGDISEEVRAFIAREVHDHAGSAAVAITDEVIARAVEARYELGAGADVYGMIHADLHQDNYLFSGRRVGAIDFDDCGWGHYLHDLSVTLSEIRGRSGFDDLRTALLRGYRAVRSLPAEHERLLETFEALRSLQLTLWILEQRDMHPGSWRRDFQTGMAELESFVRTRRR